MWREARNEVLKVLESDRTKFQLRVPAGKVLN